MTIRKIQTDTAKGRWMAAFLLLGVYFLHSVDRYGIGILAEPLKLEFGLSDAQIGAIAGTAHAIAYSACVLPIGWLLDRTNRVKLLAGMLAIWSGMTALGAFANGFLYLFLMRMGIGAAESATSPASQTLITSIFPPKQRSGAMGLVFSGTAIGTGLIFAAGGFVIEQWGWHAVFLISGIPGILLAMFIWLKLEEPPRSTDKDEAVVALPMMQAAKFFMGNRTIFFGSVGATIAAMNISSIWVWVTPILIREQGYSLAAAGAIVGVAAGVVKFLSGILSGFLSDIIAKGRLSRLWIVPSIALSLSVPVGFGIAYAPAPWVAAGLVMLLGMTMGTHLGAPKALIMSAAPANMRGSVAALEQLMVNLVGATLGPLSVGIISDYLGGESVSLALAAVLSFNLIAAWSFWFAARRIPDSESIGQRQHTECLEAPVIPATGA